MWLFRIERFWKIEILCWGEYQSQTCQSLLWSRPSPNLYDLPTATCNLEPPSSLSPASSAPFSLAANNKEPDEVTVGGNVCHQIGCVIFGICDANHTGGLPCNPSHYWFLQDKKLKHAPKGYSDCLRAGWRFRQWALFAFFMHKFSCHAFLFHCSIHFLHEGTGSLLFINKSADFLMFGHRNH